MRKCLLWLWACLIVVGCSRRPLEEPTDQSMVQVRLLIEGISNVTKDIYNEKIPVPSVSTDILRVVFYDNSGEHLLSEGFITEKGKDESGNEVIYGNVSLSPGRYRLLAYNFDTPSTLIKGLNKWSTATAYTSEISDALHSQLGNRTDNNEMIYYEPDHLFVARDADLSVEARKEKVLIKMNAESVVDTYYIQIRVKNLEHAANATAVLTGLSPANSFGDNIREEDSSASIFIEMVKSVDERIEEENQDVICAVFNTFGKLTNVPSHLYVTFNVVTRAGEIVEKTVDLAEVFATEDAQKRHWLLIDEVWELPVPDTPASSGSGGFSPEVNDWDEEEETIPIL